jgi:hypothetical protein
VVVHLIPIGPTALWRLDPSAVSWVLVWAAIAAALVLVALAGSVSNRRGIPPARAG